MENGEHLTAETTKEMDEAQEIESLKKVEAALFISGRFLGLQELVMLTDVNPLMLKELPQSVSKLFFSHFGLNVFFSCFFMNFTLSYP